MDRLLLGPLGGGTPYRVMALDTDGLTVPVTRRDAEVFGLFLRDEGYAQGYVVYVTDGAQLFAVRDQPEGWWRVTAPEGVRLQRLLGL